MKPVSRPLLYAGLIALLLVLSGAQPDRRQGLGAVERLDLAATRSALGDHLRAAPAAHPAGALVGAALGLSGAALQGYTRNPLADPGVLGVSSMAALGAVITLYFGVDARSRPGSCRSRRSAGR